MHVFKYIYVPAVFLRDKLFRFQTLHPDLPATVVDIFGMLEVEITATDEQKSKERFYWIIKSMEGVSFCRVLHCMTSNNNVTHWRTHGRTASGRVVGLGPVFATLLPLSCGFSLLKGHGVK